MKKENSKQTQNKALCKTDVSGFIRNYIHNIQLASFIYWCHKNKRFELLKMKSINVTINKCSDCPYCKELDFIHMGEGYMNGFYCGKMNDKEIRLESEMKKPLETYKIPKWCPL